MFRTIALSLITALSTLAEDVSPAPAITAPADVVASAVAAVRDLGEQVVLGRYQVAIERMNPMWKDRAAHRAGGMVALEEQLQGVAREMVRLGVSVISSDPQGQPKAFEVWPGKNDGENDEDVAYTKWLIFVPTVTTYRVMVEGEPRPVVIESTGFQVAVSDKISLDWTFIDGSSVTANELRSLFINLPADVEFPPIERREVR